MQALVLTSKDLINLHNLSELRSAMKDALSDYSANQDLSFTRQVTSFSSEKALGIMPAQSQVFGLLGYKAVTVFLQNRSLQKNPHQGLVVLLNPLTGEVQALLEGSTLTALRTAAVSAAATETLANPESRVLGIVGAGRQALEHARAICAVRKINKIKIWNRSLASMQMAVQTLRSELNSEILIADSPKAAVADCDIVVTCTGSTVPLLSVLDFAEGAHINAIGACRPNQKEISFLNRDNLKIFLDSSSACQLEAEEIYSATLRGHLDQSFILGEIGDVFSKRLHGRSSQKDITVFKSVGLGIEDLFAANYFYRRAQSHGGGTSIDFSEAHHG